ncbi:RNA 2',3'-cyclic phosphodiesterase [Photobacterium sanctipauli]|nr:RNA 2',3'-cyclic phosphodiesterase [Photobacterium sanctipauli]
MKEKKQRLFFAISPSRNAQDFKPLCQLSQRLSVFGRPVPTSNVHVTLAFLGGVSSQQTEAIRRATTRLNPPPAFTLNLDTLGYWKRSKVLWLGTESPPPAILQLAEQLKSLAIQNGINQESRPYRPHITLAKSVIQRPASLPDNPKFSFHFDHFGLYISESVVCAGRQGVRYTCLEQWPLQPTGTR